MSEVTSNQLSMTSTPIKMLANDDNASLAFAKSKSIKPVKIHFKNSVIIGIQSRPFSIFQTDLDHEQMRIFRFILKNQNYTKK